MEIDVYSVETVPVAIGIVEATDVATVGDVAAAAVTVMAEVVKDAVSCACAICNTEAAAMIKNLVRMFVGI